MTKAKQIREHKKANPQLTSKQIAATLGTSPVYVSQVLHNAKKKMIVAPKKDNPTDGQKIVRNELIRLNKEVEQYKNEIRLIAEEQRVQDRIDRKFVQQLENDIIGYRAVISYLQGKLDGSTV